MWWARCREKWGCRENSLRTVEAGTVGAAYGEGHMGNVNCKGQMSNALRWITSGTLEIIASWVPTVCWCCSGYWMQSRKHNMKFSHWKGASVVVAQVGNLFALHAESTSRDFKNLIFGTWTADDHWSPKQTNKQNPVGDYLNASAFYLLN